MMSEKGNQNFKRKNHYLFSESLGVPVPPNILVVETSSYNYVPNLLDIVSFELRIASS